MIMKKSSILLISVALAFAGSLFAQSLTPQQVVDLQRQGEAEYGKGQTGAEKAELYRAWRIANQATVFENGLPQIAEVAEINPVVASLIVRNYVSALINPNNSKYPGLQIEPIDGFDPVELSREYSLPSYINNYATAEEVAALEGAPKYVGNVRTAAKRLNQPALVTAFYEKLVGVGTTDSGYAKWFDQKILTLVKQGKDADASRLAKIEAVAVNALPDSTAKSQRLIALRAAAKLSAE